MSNTHNQPSKLYFDFVDYYQWMLACYNVMQTTSYDMLLKTVVKIFINNVALNTTSGHHSIPVYLKNKHVIDQIISDFDGYSYDDLKQQIYRIVIILTNFDATFSLLQPIDIERIIGATFKVTVGRDAGYYFFSEREVITNIENILKNIINAT